MTVGSSSSGAAERPSVAPTGARAGRRLYLDNIKTLLIAVIIVVHAVIGYADFPGAWPYSDVQEVHLTWLTVVVVFAATSPFLILMMALLFLVAGLLTPGSLDRKGPTRFAGDRLLRLGVPYAAFLVLWPALEYALYRPLGHVTDSFWSELARGIPDVGPMWFVGLLLLFSLSYAAWAPGRPRSERPPLPLETPLLLLVAGLVALGSFLIRLALPYGSSTPLSLNEWQWPECFALFAIGLAAARQGWLQAVPARVARQARTATIAAGVVAAFFLLASLPFGVGSGDILGGWHWPALVIDCVEGLMTVFGCVWMLAVAQRRLDRPFGRGPELARSAYAAFLLQGFVLIALAVAVRPLPVMAGVKATTVAVLGVLLSFGLGHLAVRRVPILSRVL